MPLWKFWLPRGGCWRPAIIKKLVSEGQPIRNTSDPIDAVKRAEVEAIQAVRQAGHEVGIIGASVMAIDYVLDAETIDAMVDALVAS